MIVGCAESRETVAKMVVMVSSRRVAYRCKEPHKDGIVFRFNMPVDNCVIDCQGNFAYFLFTIHADLRTNTLTHTHAHAYV